MIIAKTTKGLYVTDLGIRVPAKESYEEEIIRNQAIPQPTDKELIEIGKQHHPYYFKELTILNAQNNIAEIDAYELKKDKIIIDETKKE